MRKKAANDSSAGEFADVDAVEADVEILEPYIDFDTGEPPRRHPFEAQRVRSIIDVSPERASVADEVYEFVPSRPVFSLPGLVSKIMVPALLFSGFSVLLYFSIFSRYALLGETESPVAERKNNRFIGPSKSTSEVFRIKGK